LSNSSVVDEFYNIIENALILPEFGTIQEFFEHGFNLTDDDRFKKFELRYSPWITLLCDWFDDFNVDWIFLIFGSQTSKTTFMMGALLYISQYVDGACPALWVMSTENEVRDFVKDRLRNFLDESGKEAIKGNNWKISSFRLYNSSVKCGYASNKTTLRTKPCRFVFGDECGLWRESTSYIKKRTRTFAGKRKGIFATTPPDNPNHHSWKEATIGNFYQWWVECPNCKKIQAILFKHLRWTGKDKTTGAWDYKEVLESTKYQCPFCLAYWDEKNKLNTINTGVGICVDPETYKQVEPTGLKQKTLQISALYSIFTTWGQLAVDFLTAKKGGIESLRIFMTDELAETIKEQGESIQPNKLSKYEANRSKGFIAGYDIYTAGIDVQRKGELFWVVVGWKKGSVYSGHILDYGIASWKDENNKANWNGLMKTFQPFLSNIYRCTIDASDGLVTQEIQDFVTWAGSPFMALKDRGSTYSKKLEFKDTHKGIAGNRKHKFVEKIMFINSGLIKDEIATALTRHPLANGAWTFPKGTELRFYQHLGNEIRINQKGKYKWIPKYSNAPQHWFSALVYATVAKEDVRNLLIEPDITYKKVNKVIHKRGVRNKGGYNIWQ